jgi:uncharacterized protein (AIM24 family)
VVSPRILGCERAYARSHPKMRPSSPRRAPGQAGKYQRGEKYIVDTTHLVAFDASINVTPRAAGGIKSTLLSGEGLVIEMTGPGRAYIQTRSPQALINWIIPQLPKTSSSNG